MDGDPALLPKNFRSESSCQHLSQRLAPLLIFDSIQHVLGVTSRYASVTRALGPNSACPETRAMIVQLFFEAVPLPHV